MIYLKHSHLSKLPLCKFLTSYIIQFVFFYPRNYISNFKELCDSNKSRIILSEKRFSTTSSFPIYENKFFNG